MKSLFAITRSLAVAVALLALGVVGTPSSFAERGSKKPQTITTVSDLSKVQPGDSIVMSCPKCKDTWVTEVDKQFKGKPEEKTSLVHLCPTCETKVVFSGGGKNSTDKLAHTCKNCGSQDVTCCVMKKGQGQTEGMDKK